MVVNTKHVRSEGLAEARGFVLSETPHTAESVTINVLNGPHLRPGSVVGIDVALPHGHTPFVSDAYFRAAIEGSMDNVVVLECVRDDDGEIIDFVFAELNERAAQLMRVQRSDIIGRQLSEQYPHDRSSRFFLRCKSVLETQIPEEEEVPTGPQFTSRWLRYRVAPVGGALVIFSRDVSEHVDREDALRESEARFRSLVQNSSDFTFVIGSDGTLQYASPSVQRLLGYELDQFLNQSPLALVHPDDRPVVTKRLNGFLQGERPVRAIEYRVRQASGNWIWFEAITTTMLDDHAVRGIVVNARDVTERKAMDARLVEMAFYDAVTGLANRTYFMDRLRETLDRQQSGAGIAVFFMDLDRFKVVNDSLGHNAGDDLLRMVGERLAGAVRPGDILARFGGDEFAVLCETVSEVDHAYAVARRLLSRLASPFLIHGREVFMSGSVGITIAADRQVTASELLREADVAMYEAKALGRGQSACFDPAANERAMRRLASETDLRHAIDRGDFELHFQPIVGLKTGFVHGLEALVRWRHPVRGLVSPADFISLAEETGLIVPIGAWVLEEACRQTAIWRELRPERPPGVAVNLSPRQLQGSDFNRTLWRALSESGLPPELLNLEMTELALAEDPLATRQFLEMLKSIGVDLALDDFGTGYSSLGRIHQLPLDVVKIDRSFISGLGSDPSSFAIVKAVTMLAHDLGLTVIAEGIETELQRQIVSELGCDRGQGYLFARPMLASDVPAFLRDPVQVVAAG